ncbi:MAG: Ig-like domain-containing protein, partial [Gemmatimonadetes bacterium]|nr:Ig-like domain-containing protein [Gemmatimonadota bacterium]
NDPVIVTEEFSRLRFWRNTEVERLRPGERYVSIKGILGHERDTDIDNGHRPPGLFRVSATTVDNVLYCVHPGRGCETGTTDHNATLYRTSSGALVFGAGTLQWSWGLDEHHDTSTGVPPERENGATTRVGVDPNGPDRTIQQATLNLFADMGVQPSTMQPDLIAASPSTDDEPPSSTVEGPRPGEALEGTITIVGSATDEGGGVVAAVEVSTDGGSTWHPASGRQTWGYEWTPVGPGPFVLLSRAVDDSGHLETPGPGVTVGG